MNELKPCPFCGGEVCVYSGSKEITNTPPFSRRKQFVMCRKCHISSDKNNYGDRGLQEAIKAWNRRVKDE